jgi:hypothetical protein
MTVDVLIVYQYKGGLLFYEYESIGTPSGWLVPKNASRITYLGQPPADWAIVYWFKMTYREVLQLLLRLQEINDIVIINVWSNRLILYKSLS